MAERIREFFEEEGYAEIPSNLPQFTIYFRMENHYVNVFHVIRYDDNFNISHNQYMHLKGKIKELFLQKGIGQIHILSLIVCNDAEKAGQLCAEDTMCWMIERDSGRLLVWGHQVSDFYGMRGKLESFLAARQEEEGNERSGISPQKQGETKYKVPAVTAAFVAANILVFIVCTFTGNLLYNIGAVGFAQFMGRKEYYRILTSLFLHWDISHLTSNMIMLYCLGEVVERQLGSVKYGILYLTAGICGNALSMLHEYYSGSVFLSAGASGAIFGVIGALLILVIYNKGRLYQISIQISIKRMVFMIAYSLYSGFVGSNINNAAHIGGFLGGMAAALIYRLCGFERNGKKHED